MSMHKNIIFTDQRWIGLGGIGRFASEVISRLSQVKSISIKFSAFSLLNPISISLSTINKNSGVLFLPGYIPPIWSRMPYVFTIHDLNHIDRKENGSFLKSIFYNVFIRLGCWNASRVLTVSEFSKQRIVEWSGISQDKVVNVGNGVDKIYNTDIAGYDPGYIYLLCVSNRKLHKNEHRLLRAFSSAKIDDSIKMLFTGGCTNDLEVLIDDLGIKSRVVFLGRVDDSDLPALYRGANALVFPSLYEGFGLPVAEAMACGTPVITSNVTSMPEVAGDAALLVDPESIPQISAAIEKIVSDDDLRSNLSSRGLQQVMKYNWDEVATRVQTVLDSVMEKTNV